MRKNIEASHGDSKDVAATSFEANNKSQKEAEAAAIMLKAMREAAKEEDNNRLLDVHAELESMDFGEPNRSPDFSADDFVEGTKDEQQVKKAESAETGFFEEQKVELPQRGKKYKQRFSERLQNFAKPIVLALGMSFAAGAGAAAAEQRSTPRPEPTGNVEQRIDSEAQKTIEQNKAFLKQTFQSISGGEMGKMENGNLVVFVGGNYYELDSSGLNSLMQTAQRHRIGLEGTGKFDRAFHLKKVEASKMFIKGKIIELGKRVDLGKLPKNLKEFESARRQVRDEMNDFGENK